MPNGVKEKNKSESLKTFSSVARDIILIIIVCFIIICPTKFRTTMQNAGIQSIFGIELRQDLEESMQATNEALAEIEVLHDSLSILNEQLNRVINNVTNAQIKKDLKVAQNTIVKSKEKTLEIDSNLRQNLDRQDRILRLLLKKK